jgi:hypothetical protein
MPKPLRLDARRAALAEYWEQQRSGMLERVKPLVWDRQLDRDQVLADNSCFMTGSLLLDSAIEVTLVDEDELATRMLDTSAFYIQTAIERDDIGAYARVGQIELGRANRLRLLAIIRWLKDRRLDQSLLGRAIQMKQEWNEAIFSLKDWKSTDFSLSEWQAENIILGDFDAAKAIYEQYYRQGRIGLAGKRSFEDILGLVADVLGQPSGHPEERDEAELALDGFYRQITDWNAPSFRRADMLDVERFLYAYIRGKHFKDEEDPIRLIKRMKFGE